jgi:hypothetical protein
MLIDPPNSIHNGRKPIPLNPVCSKLINDSEAASAVEPPKLTAEDEKKLADAYRAAQDAK